MKFNYYGQCQRVREEYNCHKNNLSKKFVTLDVALENGDIDSVGKLVDAKNINDMASQSGSNQSALRVATLYAQTEIVEFLLKYKNIHLNPFILIDAITYYKNTQDVVYKDRYKAIAFALIKRNINLTNPSVSDFLPIQSDNFFTELRAMIDQQDVDPVVRFNLCFLLADTWDERHFFFPSSIKPNQQQHSFYLKAYQISTAYSIPCSPSQKIEMQRALFSEASKDFLFKKEKKALLRLLATNMDFSHPLIRADLYEFEQHSQFFKKIDLQKNELDFKTVFHCCMTLGMHLLSKNLETFADEYFLKAYEIANMGNLPLDAAQKNFFRAVVYRNNGIPVQGEEKEHVHIQSLPYMGRFLYLIGTAAQAGSQEAAEYLRIYAQSSGLLRGLVASCFLVSIPSVSQDLRKYCATRISQYGDFVAGLEYLYGFNNKPVQLTRAREIFEKIAERVHGFAADGDILEKWYLADLMRIETYYLEAFASPDKKIKQFDSMMKIHEKMLKEYSSFPYHVRYQINQNNNLLLCAFEQSNEDNQVALLKTKLAYCKEENEFRDKKAGHCLPKTEEKLLKKFSKKNQHHPRLRFYAEKVAAEYSRECSSSDLLEAAVAFLKMPYPSHPYNSFVLTAEKFEAALTAATLLSKDKSRYKDAVFYCEIAMGFALHSRNAKNIATIVELSAGFTKMTILPDSERIIQELSGNKQKNDLREMHLLMQRLLKSRNLSSREIKQLVYLSTKILLMLANTNKTLAAKRFNVSIDEIEAMIKLAENSINHLIVTVDVIKSIISIMGLEDSSLKSFNERKKQQQELAAYCVDLIVRVREGKLALTDDVDELILREFNEKQDIKRRVIKAMKSVWRAKKTWIASVMKKEDLFSKIQPHYDQMLHELQSSEITQPNAVSSAVREEKSAAVLVNASASFLNHPYLNAGRQPVVANSVVEEEPAEPGTTGLAQSDLPSAVPSRLVGDDKSEDEKLAQRLQNLFLFKPAPIKMEAVVASSKIPVKQQEQAPALTG